MQVADDSGFYLQYFQALLDLENKDYEAARRKLHKALANLEAAHVGPIVSVVAKHWLARTYERLGIFDEALRIMEEVVVLVRQWAETGTEFASLLAVSLFNKGLLLRELGRLRDASDAFKEAHALDSATENLQGQAQDLRGSAFVLQDSDRLEEALRLHQAALELDRKTSNITVQAIDHGNIGSVLLALGRKNESRIHLLEAKTLFEFLNAQTEALKIEELIASLESGAKKGKTS
jgi:tetratricopeptide (TPR) repeat protein